MIMFIDYQYAELYEGGWNKPFYWHVPLIAAVYNVKED